MLNKALFLDRDGVINVDFGYVCNKEKFIFVEGIFDLARQAQSKGYLLIVITNQAGIGRGYYTEHEFTMLTTWMCRVFLDNGIVVSKVYFCPSHPQFGIGEYRKVDDRRKPSPGMIKEASMEFNIDLATSILIGDKRSDVDAGLAAGIGINFLLEPKEGQALLWHDDHYVAPSLAAITSSL